MTTTKKQTSDADQDSAWKEMLDAYLPAFLQFFFPQIYPEIDWRRRYVPLDKDLAQIRPTDFTGKLLADKLFKVWLRSGQEIWLLIHVEVQVRSSRKFNRRIFVYNYRLMNAHGVEVVSLVVLTGAQPGQTGRYQIERWGCSHDFQFPAVRIADYRTRWEELEASDNPFAIAVKAHLKALETKDDDEQRYKWKHYLIFDLYKRGYKRDDIENLFRFIEWVVKIPDELQAKLEDEIYEYEVKNVMPFITNIERRGEQRGMINAVSWIWENRFGEMSEPVKSQLNLLSTEQFQTLATTMLTDKPKAEVLAWLKAQVAPKRTARKRK